eukprot:2266963-Amphidinium_carterae.1
MTPGLEGFGGQLQHSVIHSIAFPTSQEHDSVLNTASLSLDASSVLKRFVLIEIAQAVVTDFLWNRSCHFPLQWIGRTMRVSQLWSSGLGQS